MLRRGREICAIRDYGRRGHTREGFLPVSPDFICGGVLGRLHEVVIGGGMCPADDKIRLHHRRCKEQEEIVSKMKKDKTRWQFPSSCANAVLLTSAGNRKD